MSGDETRGDDVLEPLATNPWRRGWRIALAASLMVLVGIVTVPLAAVLWFTSATPVPIPPPGLSSAEVADVEARWRDFEERQWDGRRGNITLDGRELQALLQTWYGMSDRVATRIVDEEIQVRMSLPYWFPIVGRRYLNAEGIARPQRDGDSDRIHVRFQTVRVNGHPLPRAIARWIERQRDLVETLKLTVNGYDVRNALDTLAIEDGFLTLVTRAAPGEPGRRGAGRFRPASDAWPNFPFAREESPGPPGPGSERVERRPP